MHFQTVTVQTPQCFTGKRITNVMPPVFLSDLGRHHEMHQLSKDKPLNIAVALKSEISRIARKELRTETETLKKAVVAQRREIAAMKRRMQAMERQLKATSKGIGKVSKAVAPAEGEPGGQLRFSAVRFAKQRQKLGLSAAEFARILGVSSLSVYKWEQGKTRPRAAQLATIAEARKLGKKEARALLAQLSVDN